MKKLKSDLNVVPLFDYNQTRADEILNQLKGKRFFAMCHNEEKDCWETFQYECSGYEILWNLEMTKARILGLAFEEELE